jgi:ABC-type nitrate/sulfonate/bicarbonate transport system substrate-binding protein
MPVPGLFCRDSARLGARLALGLVLALLAACRREPAAKHKDGYETLELRYEGTPNYVTVAELAEDLGYLAPLKLNFVGQNNTGGPQSLQTMLSGDTDVGSSFNGAIVKMVAAGAPIKAVVASYGSDAKTFQAFYTLEGSPIRTARDLIGKKVAVNTMGAHAEFALKEYLFRAGLTPDEIAQVTMVQLPSVHTELALRKGQVDLAQLGLVFRDKALARGGIKMLFADYELFGLFNAGAYAMSKAFIAKHPNTVRKFVTGTGKAIDWARNTPREQVIARMAAIVQKRARNEDGSTLPHWQSSGISSSSGALQTREFQMWIDWLVKDGQLKPGQLKPSDVFTNDFQSQAAAALQR